MLLEALDEGGYRREDPVTAPGQMARRGGVFDLFPPDREVSGPRRILRRHVESLRAFDPDTQRTVAVLDAVAITPLSDVFAPRSVMERLRERLPERFDPAPARALARRWSGAS
jgi:transcription-repair coupling factor (superfamily II helicase)